jgi:cytochrome c oxidase cbb3-type subunit I
MACFRKLYWALLISVIAFPGSTTRLFELWSLGADSPQSSALRLDSSSSGYVAFSIYEVSRSKFALWANAALWAWSGALLLGAFSWLSGSSSGKIFLDWRNGALWAFVAALVILWAVFAAVWSERGKLWARQRRWLSGIALLGLAMVPIAIIFASSPEHYPPVDRTTGGPTGSSLLGSSLGVIGLMLILPRITGLNTARRELKRTWGFFLVCWIVFFSTEAVGGTHFDFWQIGAMACLVPWAWLIPMDWKKFLWPQGTETWRLAALGWWGFLVVSGVFSFLPEILDRLKFTQGLVAHSHLAMAGFTTSFCALLIAAVSEKSIGGKLSIWLWNAAVLVMVLVLLGMGWREGAEYSWMISFPEWRQLGLIIRTCCGAVMLAVSAMWFFQQIKK